jgi:hypothetical protein
MTGTTVGDIVGSVNEFQAPRHLDFELFDERSTFAIDTVLAVDIDVPALNRLEKEL